jgi:hypothetical protein
MTPFFGRLQVFVGDTRSRELVARCRTFGWGRMFAESKPTPYEGERWGFDNGAFGAWLQARPFPAARFQTRLDMALQLDAPALAVLPDIVAGGLTSLEFSLGWLEKVPASWPWYLAIQDGMQPADLDGMLDPLAGLFLGGTTRFKSQAAIWADYAHAAGKKFHYARAGTPTRIEHAYLVRADSLDSCLPLWDEGKWLQFQRAVHEPGRQGMLPSLAALLGATVEGDALTGCTP